MLKIVEDELRSDQRGNPLWWKVWQIFNERINKYARIFSIPPILFTQVIKLSILLQNGTAYLSKPLHTFQYMPNIPHIPHPLPTWRKLGFDQANCPHIFNHAAQGNSNHSILPQTLHDEMIIPELTIQRMGCRCEHWSKHKTQILFWNCQRLLALEKDSFLRFDWLIKASGMLLKLVDCLFCRIFAEF